MNTAVVTKIEDTGKMYKDFKKVHVELDNGQKGTVNAKTFPPPYGVGDTVEIKATWDDGNLRSIAKVTDEGAPKQSSAQQGSGKGKGGSGYDPLPGFVCNTYATARKMAEDSAGSADVSVVSIFEHMKIIKAQQDDIVAMFRNEG